MILAGGNDQAALMEELRRYFRGDVELILLDTTENVKAFPYADRFIKIDTTNKESELEAARREKVDYVLTACGDSPLLTMAYVSAQLGLPCYLTEEKTRDLTNKIYMKKKMVENAGITYYGISSGKLRRYHDWKNFTDPFRVIKGF